MIREEGKDGGTLLLTATAMRGLLSLHSGEWKSGLEPEGGKWLVRAVKSPGAESESLFDN